MSEIYGRQKRDVVPAVTFFYFVLFLLFLTFLNYVKKIYNPSGTEESPTPIYSNID